MDLFQIVKYASNFISLLYFRRVNFVGVENIPNDGPLIICGNHANQFIDPIMIASNSNRNISFTMAASSFTKPIIGSVAKGIKAIPVKRPEDSKVKGGKVRIERNDLNFYVKGRNFLEETKKLSPGWQIILGTKILKVDKVIDDETIQLCNNQEVTDINGEVVLYVRFLYNI
jgi:glycerol-3-phosphate O-acyltransferase/dihydroxyacetone phosphate acyltransferase